MKNKDLFELRDVLEDIIKTNYKSSIEFSFKIIKNKKLVEDAVNELREALKPDQDYLVYDQKRIELLKKYSTNENGEIGTKNIGNNQVEYLILPENKESFEKDITELQKENSEILANYDEKQKEISEFLDKEADDLNLNLITSDILPNDLKTTHLAKIFELIVEV